MTNLVPDPLFLQDGDVAGVANGVSVWGAAALQLVPASGVPQARAERLSVPAGGTGGFYIQLPARPGRAYTASAFIDVLRLDPGAQGAMILEWYTSSLSLAGYQYHPIDVADRHYERRVLSARSPRATSVVRLVFNLRGGGDMLVEEPQLVLGLRPGAFTDSDPRFGVPGAPSAEIGSVS